MLAILWWTLRVIYLRSFSLVFLIFSFSIFTRRSSSSVFFCHKGGRYALLRYIGVQRYLFISVYWSAESLWSSNLRNCILRHFGSRTLSDLAITGPTFIGEHFYSKETKEYRDFLLIGTILGVLNVTFSNRLVLNVDYNSKADFVPKDLHDENLLNDLPDEFCLVGESSRRESRSVCLRLSLQIWGNSVLSCLRLVIIYILPKDCSSWSRRSSFAVVYLLS